ncbi:MAG: LysM domain-containing protein [Pseudomonadota bacterium]
MRLASLTAFAAAALIGLGASSSVAASGCTGTYTIEPRDNLGKIARKCDVSVAEILRANPSVKNPSRISVGQQIAIPGAPAQAVAASVVAGGDPVITEISGRITNGRWCAMMETSDGQMWGIVSREHLFRSGTKATVRGQRVAKSRCNTAQTLLVTELTQ